MTGERPARAEKASHDLVGDHEGSVTMSQFEKSFERMGRTDAHSGSALHEWLDDQGCSVPLREQSFECQFAFVLAARFRKWNSIRLEQKWLKGLRKWTEFTS